MKGQTEASDTTGFSKGHPVQCCAVIGHEEAKRSLFQAFGSERPGHAWCLSGTVGIGKASLAWSVVKSLISDSQNSNLETDLTHPAIRRLCAGGHKDVLSLEAVAPRKGATPSLNVEEIRKVGPFLHRSSAESGWRIALIDGADAMTTAAANALLKTLEEPPSKSLILLICHSLAHVPATVLSRCRKLKLNPLSQDMFYKVMFDLQKTGLMPDDLSDSDLEVLFSLSSSAGQIALGSPGRAMNFHQSGASEIWQLAASCLAAKPEDRGRLIQSLSEPCGSREGWFDSILVIVPALARRIALALASGAILQDFSTRTPAEQALLDIVQRRGDAAEKWLKIHDAAEAAFDEMIIGNLDRKLGVELLLRHAV